MRALLSVADRSGLPELARDLVAGASSSIATDGTREALTAEGIERQCWRPDRHAAPCRWPGQDLPTERSTPASWPDATVLRS